MACRALLALLFAVSATSAAAAEPSPLKRCWTSTFTTQLSGTVREQNRLAPSHMDVIALHDGNFRWVGEPKEAPAHLTYTYCFREISDQGGVLFADGKPIAMTRKAGGQRMARGAESTMVRDGDVMETLYTRTGDHANATSIEILYDAQTQTTRLTMFHPQGNGGMLAMLTAPAVPTDVPAGAH